MTTLRWLRRITVPTLGVLLALDGAAGQSDDAAFRRAKAVLRTTPIIDGHNDLPWVIREKGVPPRDVEAYDISKRSRFDTDIPRLREGMVGAQFWSVYVPSGLSPIDAMRSQLEQIDIARRLIAKYPRDLGFATSVSTFGGRWLAGGSPLSLAWKADIPSSIHWGRCVPTTIWAYAT